MTRFILLTIVAVFLTLQVSAQDKRGDRIKAMKVAYLTDKLELTPEESQNFWPLYNELSSKLREIKKSGRAEKVSENISEAEALELINKQFDNDQRELDLKKAYALKMKEVISPVKLIRLSEAEKEFKRELLHRAKGKRGR